MAIAVIEFTAPAPGTVGHFQMPGGGRLLQAQWNDTEHVAIITALADPENPTVNVKIGAQFSNVPLARLGDVKSFQGSVFDPHSDSLIHYFEVG